MSVSVCTYLRLHCVRHIVSVATDQPVLPDLLPSSTVVCRQSGLASESPRSALCIYMHVARFCIMHTRSAGGAAQVHLYATFCVAPDGRDARVGGSRGFAVIFRWVSLRFFRFCTFWYVYFPAIRTFLSY